MNNEMIEKITRKIVNWVLAICVIAFIIWANIILFVSIDNDAPSNKDKYKTSNKEVRYFTDCIEGKLYIVTPTYYESKDGNFYNISGPIGDCK